MQEYRDAARLLFAYTNGYSEIGAVVEDGARKAAIEVMVRSKADKDTNQYLVNINWQLLDELAKKEENEK